MGAGEHGLSAQQVAPSLVEVAIEFFQTHPQTALTRIYLLAHTSADKDACLKALRERSERGELRERSELSQKK
jgi:hypothetical protein